MSDVQVTAKFANNIIDRLTGLIGKHQAHGLLIKTRFGIHTFFLKFPIDVVVLDGEGSVVKLQKHLKPHRLFFWNPRFNRVLELPNKTIDENNIQMGTKINLSKDEVKTEKPY